MNRITFPLKPNDTGPAVADLQAGLRFLIDKNFFGFDKAARAEAITRLNAESSPSVYGAETKRLVTTFQKFVGLPTDGIVNEATAIALNDRLAELGAFDASAVPRLVAGKVSQESGAAIPGAPVRAFHVGDGGALRLGADTTDPDGGYTIAYAMPPGLAAIQLRVVAYADNKVIADSGLLPNAPPLQFVNLKVGRETQYTVTGRVASPTRAGGGGLRVEIVDKAVGGDRVLAETATDASGAFQGSFPNTLFAGRQPNLQVRVSHNGAILGASEVRYNAAPQETLDVRLNSAKTAVLASEYTTLTAAIRNKFDGKLAEMQETASRQDITVVANLIGWDARIVAMAALADQASSAAEQAGATIEPEFFYALLRAGVDATALYTVDVQTVAEIWQRSMAQGIIPADLAARQLNALDAFQQQAAAKVLVRPPAVGASTLADLLAISFSNEPAVQLKVAKLFVANRNDPDAFWGAVATEFGDKEKVLRTDNQLAFLTWNNTPLIAKLHAASPQGRLQSPGELAPQGYYAAQKWQKVIAGTSIPAQIPGDNAAAREANYAEVLAAQVRLSFPTAVARQMIAAGELQLPRPALKDPVAAFLAQHHDYVLGAQPVEQFLAQKGVPVDKQSRAVVAEIKALERVVQITPDFQATNALLRNGIDSAQAVIRWERAAFVRAFATEVGGQGNAELIYDQAQRVHSTVLQTLTAYLTQAGTPGIGVPSGQANGKPLFVDAAPTGAAGAGVLAQATLASIFGDQDFCTCEECRSMLSPAAYLVDLLHFLDRDDPVWTAFLANWQEDRGAPYPFANAAEWQHAGKPPGVLQMPLAVLLARRPDLQHLPLTCENTNTPLPYIDIVNEVLEHYVISGSLAEYTGHSTDGSASPEELLANPQFVADQAYTKLAEASFPLLLPFDQRLETLRRHFDHFDAPLPAVMEALRTNDSVEPPNPQEYGWRDILIEELRLSPGEYGLLTAEKVQLADLYGFSAGTQPAEVRAGLTNARAFARRLGITYEELVELLRTRFVNPGAALIPLAERLGVSLTTLKRFHDNAMTPAEFDAAIAPQLDPRPYGGNIKAWVKNEAVFKPLMGLITLASVGEGCGFDKFELRYADPARSAEPLSALDFVRLLRFIRLWKKLGWAIADTDKAITALYPPQPQPKPVEDDETALRQLGADFRTLLPRLGVLRRVLTALKRKPQTDLLPVLALFAALDTHGEYSLYRRMFLSSNLAVQDPAFAGDGSGAFLKDENAKLLEHAETLRAAFALTAEEFDLITAALKFDASTQLSVEKISDIYRRGWLAHTLKLSVRELLRLVEFTAIDPFAAPDPPEPPILKLLELLSHLRSAGLKPTQALYLIWNEDVSGKSAPREVEVLDFVRQLRTGLAAVDSEFRMVDDPDGQIARARMALVYGGEATDFFFGLLDGVFATEVQYDHIGPVLGQPILDAALGQITYDDFRKRLSIKGLITAAVRDAVKAAGPAGEFQTAVDNLFAENRKVLDPFFARHPELLPRHAAFVFFGDLKTVIAYTHHAEQLGPSIVQAAQGRLTYDKDAKQLAFKGVLPPILRDRLAALPDETPEFQAAVTRLFANCQLAIAGFFQRHAELAGQRADYLAADDSRGRRVKLLLASILPELLRRRKQQQTTQTLGAVAGTEVEFTGALLDNQPQFTAPLLKPGLAQVYVLHAANDLNRPALDDLVAVELPGLSAHFFFGPTASGKTALPIRREANLAYAPNANSLPENGATPGSPLSGIWRGYLEAPEDAFYKFLIHTEADARVTLRLNDAEIAFDAATPELGESVFTNKDAIELRAGKLYPFVLQVENVKATLAVHWQTRGRGREVIPARFLYPDQEVEALRLVYVRFLKAASLAAALKLHADELAYLAAHPLLRSNRQGWLNDLAVLGSPNGPALPQLRALEALLDFARFKAAFGGEDGALLAVLQDPVAAAQASVNTPDGALFSLTRWERSSLVALLAHFSPAGGNAQKNLDDLADLTFFRRIYDAMRWVRQMGISAAALSAAARNELPAEGVRQFQAALRARFSVADWLKIVKPINDELRARQRDALVAHILRGLQLDAATAHIDTPDKLFEFFLMDVQMEPCMQTSRIRHALSTVQLFIDRCLMNLESAVAPAVLDARQWEWMNRYRMWEANRKVFLFPENWLEPELRDDQSPFYKEVIGELLQGDITDDRAEIALLNYLNKLDEVARLEPCGIFYEEDKLGTEARDDVIHVVARAAGANRRYYYCCREFGVWRPWEQIRLDIEGNPVIPVMWNGRLLLFWLQILQDAPVSKPPEVRDLGSPDVRDQRSSTDILEIILSASPAPAPIKAVLAWSEYYNGKWQPVRTSDINRPVDLGSYAAKGAGVFNRNDLRLEASVALDPLSIRVQGTNIEGKVIFEGSEFRGSIPTFNLFNTHNATVKEGGAIVGIPTVFRSMNTSQGILTISYGSNTADLELPVLRNRIGGATDSAVVPLHDLDNVWEAPFFYADQRHIFLVETDQRVIMTAPDWEDIIGFPIEENGTVRLPGLLQRETPVTARVVPIGDAKANGVRSIAVEAAVMRQFVSEDAYIHCALGATGVVQFGRTQIGPAGAVQNENQKD